ncbi:MAG: CRTAC1 family protein, partial [Bacteroidota bacterium]
IGISDMNGDGKDDIVHLQDGRILYIEYQNKKNEEFISSRIDTVSEESEWALCIADVDNNGRNDVLIGGQYNGLKLYRGDESNSFQKSVLPLDLIELFAQGTNFIDIDNDGWVDVFSCHDEADNQKFRNLGDGSFIHDNSLINTVTAIPSDNSGNYSSIWTDYDDDGDLDMYLSKCRQGVTSATDPRRVNMLLQNDGNGNFQEVAAVAGLDIGAQSWATEFADIDNDGDLDAFVINHFEESQLLENNGDGTFSDISEGSGFFPTLKGVFGIQAIMRDLDNDGFVDLLFSGNQHHLFLNQGDKTFEHQENPFTADQIESLAVGDLNYDGFLDVYAGYAYFFTDPSQKPDKLFFNDANDNHFLAVSLEGDSSNRSGIGARLYLYGAWGVQTREVRSGEGYGIMNSLSQHFGLGTATEVDSLVVFWPSGVKDKLISPISDRYLRLRENSTKPVEFDFFDLRENRGNAQLLWQTSTEQGISSFTVQRSKDRLTWQSLEEVSARGGINIRSSYTFLDEASFAATSYYRLKQNKRDGNHSFSEVKEIFLQNREKNWIAAPNPSEDLMQIISLNGPLIDFSWQLLSADGRRWDSGDKEEEVESFQLDLQKLVPGHYFLQIWANDGSWQEHISILKP